MEDFLRNLRYFGLGLFAFSKEKIEAAVEEMIKRGEVNEKEGAQKVEEILEDAKKEQKAFFDQVMELIRKIVSEMRLARAADLEALERRVSQLEKELLSRQAPPDQTIQV